MFTLAVTHGGDTIPLEQIVHLQTQRTASHVGWLDRGVLAAENEALVYCSVTGFGRDGPEADKGGFDLVAQGFAGLMAITGEPDRPPVKIGPASVPARTATTFRAPGSNM